MPIQTGVKKEEYGSGGSTSGLERGVYEAQFAYMGDKITDTKIGRKIFFRFVHGDDSMSLSASPDQELVRVVFMLTGQKMQVSNENVMLEAAKQLVAGLEWTGLVEWDGKFIRQLRVPRGDYRLRFCGFTTRDGVTGKATTVPSKKPGGTAFVNYDVEVVKDKEDGRYVGWHQIGYLPASWTVSDETGLLRLADTSGLNAFVIGFGLQEGQLAGHVFSSKVSPIPLFEEILLGNAERGALADMFFGDTFMEWKSLKPAEGSTPTPGVLSPQDAGPDVSVQPQVESYLTLMIEHLEAIAQSVWGQPTPIAANQDGSQLNEKGLYLARNLLRPIVAAMPDSGIILKWPPTEWSTLGAANGNAILGKVSEQDNEWMMVHLGDSDVAHVALGKWIKDVYLAEEDDQEGGLQEL